MCSSDLLLVFFVAYLLNIPVEPLPVYKISDHQIDIARRSAKPLRNTGGRGGVVGDDRLKNG